MYSRSQEYYNYNNHTINTMYLIYTNADKFQSRKRIAELDTEIDTTVTKTARKIQTLKAQFHEHRDKWQAVSLLSIYCKIVNYVFFFII